MYVIQNDASKFSNILIDGKDVIFYTVPDKRYPVAIEYRCANAYVILLTICYDYRLMCWPTMADLMYNAYPPI